jgi:hypothetical protein
MKRWAIALAVLLALVIGWIAWNSGASKAPPVVGEATKPTAAAPSAEANLDRGAPKQSTASSAPEAARPAASPAAPAALDSAEILVRGSVRDEQGQPAKSAYLRWVESSGTEHFVGCTDGAYAAPGLRPGHYLVVLGGEAYKREELQVDLAATPQVQQRDFVVHAGMRFPIRVVDASGASPLGPPNSDSTRRVRHLTVRATRQEPPSVVDAQWAATNQLSECGEFLPSGYLEHGHEHESADFFGLLSLSEPPPLYVSLAFGNQTVASRRIEELPKELVFTIDPEKLRSMLAGLRVRILDSDGRSPLPGVGVTLMSQHSAGQRAATGDDGRAEFADLYPGAYDLNLFLKGRPPRGREVVPVAGQLLDLGDIVMLEGGAQYVRIEFPGSLRPDVAFVIHPADPGNPLGTLDLPDGSIWAVRSSNRVSIPFPGPGSYDLRIVLVGDPRERETIHLGALPTRIVFGDTPGEDVVVRLEETSTVALIPPKDPPPGVRWLISTAAGQPAKLVRIEGSQPKLVELPRGSYSVMPVSSEKGLLDPVEPQSFTVGAESSAVELPL